MSLGIGVFLAGIVLGFLSGDFAIGVIIVVIALIVGYWIDVPFL